MATEHSPDARPAPHVLVVDDHEDSAHLVAILLRRAGYGVDVATSGRGAIEKAAAKSPVAVLLDITLPDMDGYAVLAELKRQHASDATFIAITGHATDEHVQRSLDAGFHHHVVKPFRLEELLPLLPPRN